MLGTFERVFIVVPAISTGADQSPMAEGSREQAGAPGRCTRQMPRGMCVALGSTAPNGSPPACQSIVS